MLLELRAPGAPVGAPDPAVDELVPVLEVERQHERARSASSDRVSRTRRSDGRSRSRVHLGEGGAHSRADARSTCRASTAIQASSQAGSTCVDRRL